MLNDSVLRIGDQIFTRISTCEEFNYQLEKFNRLPNTRLPYWYRSGNVFRSGEERKESICSMFGYGYLFAKSIKEAINSMSNDYSYGNDDIGYLITNGDITVNQEIIRDIKLSVILPAFGVNAVIRNVVESVRISCSMIKGLKWECIVIDDANNERIALNQENVKVLRSEKRLYSAGARNSGIINSTGNVVMFLDADTLLAPNYIKEHLARHILYDNLITVSMRDHVDNPNIDILNTKPSIEKDSRYYSTYYPGRIGLVPVTEPIKVQALKETENFRRFGFGRLIGPADLPFMVKGNNLMVRKHVAQWMFNESYKGYGPEDVEFAAKAIARGCMVAPVLNTGVFHIDHPARSGDKKNEELKNNLKIYEKDLEGPVWEV